MSIRVEHLKKRFGTYQALDGVSLEIPSGELVALLGPSGSGKTTLLRIIAGLETADAGTVRIAGAGSRRVGFVFQHYALFKHMTVEENVAFGLTVRPRPERPSKAEIRDRVHEVLAKVHLEGLAARHPDELSGGQRQRVALARALAVEPEVLLLDEPFGALDAQVRLDLRRWLRRLHEETGLTSVFVTHDQEEALELADRVAVLNRGRIEQVGTPEEVYGRPATPFVYGFIGQVNLFHGRVQGGVVRVGEATVVPAGPTPAEGARVRGYLRPHDLGLSRAAAPGALPAVVKRIHILGPLARVRLEASHDQSDLEAHISMEELARQGLEVGECIFVKPSRLDFFADPTPETPADWVI